MIYVLSRSLSEGILPSEQKWGAMPDMALWLTVVIGISQLLLGGMGVYVSLRPPKKEHHWFWMGGFILVGLIGVVVTGVLAKAGDTAQRQANETQDALRKEVKVANDKLDQSKTKQDKMEGSLSTLQTIVGELKKNGADSFAAVESAISKARPKPPGEPELQFSLWRDGLTIQELPLKSMAVSRDADGNIPVEFTISNVSGVSADDPEIWVEVCQGCSFAAEPALFSRPNGLSEKMRFRRIPSLSPNDRFEKQTVLVKYPGPDNHFEVAMSYTCKTCTHPQRQTFRVYQIPRNPGMH